VYNHEDGTFDEEKRQTIILQAIGVNVAVSFPHLPVRNFGIGLLVRRENPSL
jgi:hypothetical protein